MIRVSECLARPIASNLNKHGLPPNVQNKRCALYLFAIIEGVNDEKD